MTHTPNPRISYYFNNKINNLRILATRSRMDIFPGKNRVKAKTAPIVMSRIFERRIRLPCSCFSSPTQNDSGS